jgi:hypothetical protein
VHQKRPKIYTFSGEVRVKFGLTTHKGASRKRLETLERRIVIAFVLMAELLCVQPLSFAGAKVRLASMPHEHDLRIPPQLMKWALATYLQAPLLQQPLDCSRCEQGEMDVWGSHAMRCHIGLKHRHDALICARSRLFGAAGRLKSIEPVAVFAGVQDEHERADHYILADNGQDLFTATSMVFANHRHVRVVVGERERVKVNKYDEKCRRAGTFFQPLVLEARSGWHVQDHRQHHQEAFDAGGS